MGGLPLHVQNKIGGLLSEIQVTFKPGAKVMLVVDNGTPALSLMMGDADMDRVVSLMRNLSAASDADEKTLTTPRPLSEYHEDHGFVTWWVLPIREPAWIGSPNCSDWPGYHTHWTPHPPCPEPSA